MKKKLYSITCVILLVIYSLIGCTSTSSTEESLTKVTLNEVAHSIFYAPQYVAMELGYFEEEGIDLTLVTGFGADKTMTALLTEEADIGFMGPEASIYTYANGASDYPVNFAQLTQRAGNFLVAREPIDNFDWSMIKETTILAGRAGGMPQMVFEYILAKNGIVPATDLNMDQSIDFGLTAAAFSSGQGDFTIEFEPYATALALKGDGYVVASLGEESGYVPYTAYCAMSDYMVENEEIILAFIRAIQKGVLYVNEHTPEEIAEVIQPQFEETEFENLTAIIERYQAQDTWKTSLLFEEDSFTLLQNILMECDVLEEAVPYEELVDTTYVERIVE
ncbi:MAG: ABC transporter substrate-binding protein [Eubacteriales bacterium]